MVSIYILIYYLFTYKNFTLFKVLIYILQYTHIHIYVYMKPLGKCYVSYTSI